MSDVRTADVNLPASAALSDAILNALSDVVIVADEANRVVLANDAVTALLGWAPEELTGQPLMAVIPPRLREQHLAAYMRFMQTGEAHVMGRALRMPALRKDGAEVQVDLTIHALPDGDRVYTIGVLRDAAPRLAYEREAELARRLLRVLAQAATLPDATAEILEVLCTEVGWDGAAMWTSDDSRRLTCLDFWHAPSTDMEAFERLTRASAFAPGIGLPGRVWATGQPVWIADVQRDDNFPRRDAARRSSVHAALAFPVAAQGEPLAVIELVSQQRRAPDAALLGTLQATAGELGHFILRKRLEAELEESNRRIAFLGDASRILGGSLEYRTTLQQLTAEMVPAIADWVAIDLLEHGALDLIASSHVDRTKAPLIPRLRERFPPQVQQLPWVMQVLTTGSSMLHEDIPHDLLRATARTAEESDLLLSLGLRSAIVVPLILKGAVAGVMTLARGSDAARYGRGDMGLAEDLGRRIALAVENGRLHEREVYIARTLQRALLPTDLPQPPHADVAATYRAAPGAMEVGGDFYDVFQTPRGWALVIGDVSGKGVEAAAVTAMVRFTIRAIAGTGATPAETLRLTHASVRPDLPKDRYCTVVLAEVREQEDGFAVTVACGGHPSPLLVREGGAVEEIGTHGQPLGLLDAIKVTEVQGRLGPGDTIVLYTDGVTDCWPEERGFADSVRRQEGTTAADAVRQLEAEALAACVGVHRDDMAMLVMHVRGPEA